MPNFSPTDLSEIDALVSRLISEGSPEKLDPRSSLGPLEEWEPRGVRHFVERHWPSPLWRERLRTGSLSSVRNCMRSAINLYQHLKD